MATLTELFRVAPFEADVFAARFSPAGTYLALGLGDGTVSIHHARTGKALALVPATTAATGGAGGAPAPASMGLPITALRWRPEGAAQFKVSEATTAKDVLLAAGSDGAIRHIHANSGRVLSTIVDQGAQIFACDYRALACCRARARACYAAQHPQAPLIPPPPDSLPPRLPRRRRRRALCHGGQHQERQGVRRGDARRGG
jgi:hypothetical protein